MRLAHRFSIAALAASALLASCSGGSHSGPSTVLPSGGSTATTTSGAQFTVSVPRQQSQAANRQTAAVSAGIASLVITAVGTASASTTINIAAGAPGCTSTPTSISCIGTINLVPGTYTFAVKEYSAANGTGSVLGTGSVSQTLAPGALTNVLLTLNGVVSSIQLALNPTTLPSGTATTATLTVMALDPSGNVIVGPGNFIDANGNPVAITVSTSGGSGITLSASQVTSATNTVVTVTYSGTSVSAGTQALFHATATGLNPAQAVALTFTTAGTHAGSLYLVNEGFLEQYSIDGTSLITQLFSPSFPYTLGYDGSGNLFLISPSSILVYAAGIGTSGTPLRTIGGSKFPSSFTPCYCSLSQPVVDSHGAVYGLATNLGNNVLQVFSSTASGNVAPDKTWTLTNVAGYITSVAVDTDGSVYVASNNQSGSLGAYLGEIDVFPSSTPSGPVTSARTISLSEPPYYSGPGFFAMGLDAQHNLYAFDTNVNQISVFPAGTSGSYTPGTFYDGTSYGTYGFTVEQSGAVDVLSYGPVSHVSHFPAGSSGQVTPVSLTSSGASFQYGTGIAATPSGGVAVIDEATNGTIETFSASAVATGGAVAATSQAPGIPFGVGNIQNVTVAPNGDILVTGFNGADSIDIYAAGTLALGTPARKFTVGAAGNIGAAFEDVNGYVYAIASGPSGRGGDSLVRRGGTAAASKAKAVAAAAAALRKVQASRRPAGYEVNENEIAVFAPGASGSALPIRTIEVPLQYLSATTVSADGTIYSVGPGSVVVIAPGTSTPKTTIPYTMPPGSCCSSAYIIAVDSLGWIYFSEGSVIYTVKPSTSTVAATFPITSLGATAPVLLTDANNLYAAVDAGFESYPLSSMRALSGMTAAPALNANLLPAVDPTISSPQFYSAFFGN